LASAAVLQVLREARNDGMTISALYPAVLRPYRRLGYELGGSFCEHRLDLDAIPSDLGAGLPAVEVLDVERDLEGLKACYRQWSRPANGPLEPTEDRWWTQRILQPFGEAISRAVVVRGDGGSIEGFAVFRYVSAEGGHLDIEFGLECLALATTTDCATRALFAYFRSFRGVGLWVQSCGPPEDPIAMLIPEQSIETPFRFRWMTRLLDVRAALTSRGYPAIDAEAVVAVHDPEFPDNDGPWRLTVRDGEARVEAADSASDRALPIGILSALFTGSLHVPDAVRLGYIGRDDPAAGTLERLFAGADPWCPFFF
jgi:predicted acetyltransferase